MGTLLLLFFLNYYECHVSHLHLALLCSLNAGVFCFLFFSRKITILQYNYAMLLLLAAWTLTKLLMFFLVGVITTGAPDHLKD